MTQVKTINETAEHICVQLAELARVASESKLDVLAHLMEILTEVAFLEAEGQQRPSSRQHPN
jgi:hypothetical protein